MSLLCSRPDSVSKTAAHFSAFASFDTTAPMRLKRTPGPHSRMAASSAALVTAHSLLASGLTSPHMNMLDVSPWWPCALQGC